MSPDVALVVALLMAFTFAATNGFLDAANAIATLVATRAARPLPAVLMAAVFNLAGPLLFGAAVANAVGKIVSVPPDRAVPVIGAGLTGAVVWNIVTWRRRIPSSSSHALVGGLVGAGLLDSGIDAIEWGPVHGGRLEGVFGVLLGLLLAVVLGFTVAVILDRLALRAMSRASVRFRSPVRAGQWVASAWLAFSHGSNDAQKTIGIAAALLLAGHRTTTFSAPLWVTVVASLALTLGTALGGWGIVKTIGRRIFPIRALDGLVSQTTSASVILSASFIGAPISTTQVVSASVVGIGIGRRRWRHIGWQVVRNIGLAWLTTMPAAGCIAALFLPAWKFLSGG